MNTQRLIQYENQTYKVLKTLQDGERQILIQKEILINLVIALLLQGFQNLVGMNAQRLIRYEKQTYKVLKTLQDAKRQY